MVSPTRMSSNPAILSPHSNPSATSRASSLNRLRFSSLPVWMTCLSRITRTWFDRSTLPSTTRHPAIVPTREMRNVSFTWIWPVTTSTLSGTRSPSRASFISSITW